MAQKLTCKGDSKNIDLFELYLTLLATKDKPLLEAYPFLYNGKRVRAFLCVNIDSVLHIHVRKATDNIKIIRNNINFKIKNLVESYLKHRT